MKTPVVLLTLLATLTWAWAQEAEQCVGIIELAWPGQDLSGAQVRFFRDAARQDLAAAFPATSPEGKVVVAIPAGTYYLAAVADRDKDGKIGPGDGLGFSGVVDPTTDQPGSLVVKDPVFQLWLPISLVMNTEGKLAPTGVTRPTPPPAAKAVMLRGTVTETEPTGLVLVYAVPKDGGACVATLPAADGTWALELATGEYYLFAVQDVNGTEQVDSGDRFAVFGYRAEQGRTFPTTTFAAQASGLTLALTWRLTESGLLKAVAGEAEGPQTAPETIPAVVFGRVVGTEATTTIGAANDARFSRPAGSFRADQGRFTLALPAGTYFFNLLTDTDGDAQASPGDLVGFYGVGNLRLGHGPQPLLLVGGEIRPLDFTLVGKLGADLKPVPLP